MKKLIAGLLSLVSLSALANPTVIGKIQERGTSREIVITHDKNADSENIVYTLKDRSITQELNRVELATNEQSIEARGSHEYKFNLFKAGINASGSLYKWCWVENALVDDTDFGPIIPTVSTIAGSVIGAIVLAGTGGTVVVVPVAIAGAGIAFCTAGAAVPALVLSAALLPIDAAISAASHFSANQTANRKIEKALSGDDRKASKRVFKKIIEKIQRI